MAITGTKSAAAGRMVATSLALAGFHRAAAGDRGGVRYAGGRVESHIAVERDRRIARARGQTVRAIATGRGWDRSRPVPLMAVAVSPEGTVSVTVTAPLVAPAPAALLTVMA